MSTVEPGVEAGLLLFFNNRLFCGMGIDGERMLSYSGGIRTHWREPAPATDRITLRIRNDEHIVTGWYRVPGGRVDAPRDPLRDLRLPRQHRRRPAEPAPRAVRDRDRARRASATSATAPCADPTVRLHRAPRRWVSTARLGVRMQSQRHHGARPPSRAGHIMTRHRLSRPAPVDPLGRGALRAPPRR